MRNYELKQRISRIKRIISRVARGVFWWSDYAVQCRDATCGVRDNSLIASIEDAWCIEDETLFEGPCNPKGLGEMPKRELSEAKHVVLDRALALDPTLQPRRGAPLGHKRAERQVPRRGTLMHSRHVQLRR